MKTRSLLILSALVLSAQAAPPLLLQPGAAASAQAADRSGCALRVQSVRVNPLALPGQAAAKGARTRLNLFPDADLEVEWQKLARHGANSFAWYGTLVDDRLSAVTLTTVEDATVLQVVSPRHGHFELESRSDGGGRLRQFDPEQLKGNGNCFVQTSGFGTNEVLAGTTATTVATASAVTPVTIDVLMVYTTKAKDLLGGRSAIVAKAQSAVDGENHNFDRSNIAHNMRLVQTREVSHVASGSLPTELSWVAGSSTVASIRNEVGADLVAFISDRDDAGVLGISTQLGSTSGNSSQAFSANYYNTLAGVWPHEAGHNFGCQHNSPGLYSYSSGHYWDDSGTTYGTIMSYIGLRIPYFSNPDINYSGHATGTADRDNARTIDNTGPDVAGYRTAKTLIEPSCSMTTSASKPVVGTNFTLTITSVNGGPATATNVKIAVTLPPMLALVSQNGGSAFDPASGIWSVPSMADSAKQTLVLTVYAKLGSAGTSLAPSASISSVGSGFVDFNYYNNSDSVAIVPAGIPLDDLVLHFKLDEASGQTALDSADLEGGIQSPTTGNTSPQWLPGGGIIGGALRFTPASATDLSQAFTYNSASAILGGYPFTLGLWMRATPGGWNEVCAFLGDPSVDSSYYELSLSTAFVNAVARNTTKVLATSPAALPVADDQWHHLAGVYTANQRTLYVDGVAVATNTTTVSFVTNCKRFAIGALMRKTPTDAFSGYLDDIGLWNVALSPERIALIHGLGRYSGADLDDSAIDTLLAVQAAGSGFAGAGGVVWVPACGLSGAPGSAGLSNGLPYVVLTAGGQGLTGLTRPQLTLTPSADGSISLAWHSGFANWILEESTDLSPDGWSPSAEPVSDDGLTRSIRYSLSEVDSRFFRLKAP